MPFRDIAPNHLGTLKPARRKRLHYAERYTLIVLICVCLCLMQKKKMVVC